MGVKFNIFTGQLDLTGSAGGVGIGTPITSANEHRILLTDGTSPDPLLTESAALANGQILIGSTGAAPIVANISGTTNQIAVTNGAGSITLSTPQNIDTAADVEFGSANLTAAIGLVVDNESQLDNIKVSGSTIDLMASGTIAIGGLNSDIVNLGAAASTINIGNPTATVNIQGSINNIETTNLNVTDALITINNGGPAASAGNTGIEIEEDSVVTGYMKTSVDRNDLVFKAPAQAGVVTMPGPAGNEIVAYQSYVTTGLADKADTNLGNLSSPTAFNQDLLPDTDVTRSIGSNANRLYYMRSQNMEFRYTDLVDAAGVNYYGQISGNLSGADVNIEAYDFLLGSNLIGLYLGSAKPLLITSTNRTETSDVSIKSGNASSGNSGNININTGTAIGTRGEINVDARIVNITADDSILLNPDLNSSITLKTSGVGSTLIQTDSVVDLGPNVGSIAPTLNFWTGDWNYSIGLKAANTGTGNVTFTLPTSDGSSDQVLKTNGSGQLSWKTINDFSSTGSFSGANGQAVAADVTGLSFSQTGKAIIEVAVDATTGLYEAFDVLVIKKASTYELTYSTVGDLSGVVLSITSSGQIQYTSDTYPGFVSLTIRSKKVQL